MTTNNKKKFVAPIRSKEPSDIEAAKNNEDKASPGVDTVLNNSAAPNLPRSSGNIDDADYLPSSQSSNIVSLTQASLQRKKRHRKNKDEASDNAVSEMTKEVGDGTKSLKENTSVKKSSKKKFFEMCDIIKQPNKKKKRLDHSKDDISINKRKESKSDKKVSQSSSSVKQSSNPNNILRSQRNTQPPHNVSHRERLLWLQNRRGDGLWVQCDKPECNKWRYLADVADPTTIPHQWFCSMNSDENQSDCSAPQKLATPYEEEDLIYNKFTAGSLVWARFGGYPWWPAMVDDCPDTEMFYWLNGFSDIPTHYHVVFFDIKEVTRAWVTPSNLHSFLDKRSFIERNIHYKKRIKYAFECGYNASKLPIKERLKQYSFLALYKGPIISPLPTLSDSEDDTEFSVTHTSILKKTLSGKSTTASLLITEDVQDVISSLENLMNNDTSINSSRTRSSRKHIKVIENGNNNKHSDTSQSQKNSSSYLVSENSDCRKISNIVDENDSNSTNMDSNDIDENAINCSPDLFGSQNSKKQAIVKPFNTVSLNKTTKLSKLVDTKRIYQRNRKCAGRISLSQPTMSIFAETRTRLDVKRFKSYEKLVTVDNNINFNRSARESSRSLSPDFEIDD